MNLDLKTIFDQFCAEGKVFGNKRDATIRWYQTSIKVFYNRRPDITQLKDFNEETLRSFLCEGRLTYNWNSKTFMSYYGAFRSFLNWCVKRKYIPENPILSIEKPRKEKTLPRAISKEDVERILDYSFHRKTTYRFDRYKNRAAFALMIFAGLRIREVLDLKLNNVDFENNAIFIEFGKGAKDRIIPMCARLKQYLLEYVEERTRMKRTSPYFITSGNRDRGMTYHGMKKVIENIRKKLKISFTSHKLRHTFATLMIEGGCNIYALSKMLGHSDIKTTTIYLSASAEHLQEQIVKHPLNNL